ncbi:sporulation protein [Sulfuricaulis limicola]|uniref:Sporulation protein n=1 Tax=Sulfuricaulis limicola TaxID=1620215 RepID=A0A1B4XC27_9GAMM|nr:SPOR domain-containing protein [Sulfuricaulis limicola]BAV32378.1 sporulation protein [Sulfuricaulis limicola]
MARRRRSFSVRRFRKPGWLFLLVGIGIGVAGVMLWQMYSHRGDGRSGLGNLFSSINKPAEKPVKKEPEPAKPPKPKFDFYTILPETETVLPERRARAKPVQAKPEEGVSYILQAGSFAGFEEADNMKARLALGGLVAHIQKITIEGKGEYHRVRLGPYENIDQLDATAAQLQKMGIKAIRLKVKKGETG